MGKKLCFIILIVIFTVLGYALRRKIPKTDIQHENKEKILSCKVRVVDENIDFSITESYAFYFDNKEDKLTKYIQTMSFDYNSDNAVNEYAEKNYNSAIEMCNGVKDISGVYCSIKNNEKTNFVVEFGVHLTELDENGEISNRLNNLKEASYNQIYEEFVTVNKWKCETYFE